MLKILEAISMILITKFAHKVPAPAEPGLGMEFVLSKSRTVMIGFFFAIITAVMLTLGIGMGLVGLCLFYADSSNPLSHALMVTGLVTAVICISLAGYGLSKKRFNIEGEHEKHSNLPVASAPEPNPGPTQIIEEVVVAVIKDFAKQAKISKTAAVKQTSQ